MSRMPKMDWWEKFKTLREALGAFIVVVGILTSIGTAVALFSLRWLDARMEQHTEPLREILIWELTDSGRLQKFEQFKASQDSVSKLTEVRRAAILIPLGGL